MASPPLHLSPAHGACAAAVEGPLVGEPVFHAPVFCVAPPLVGPRVAGVPFFLDGVVLVAEALLAPWWVFAPVGAGGAAVLAGVDAPPGLVVPYDLPAAIDAEPVCAILLHPNVTACHIYAET